MRRERGADRSGEAIPVVCFYAQALAAGGGEFVKLGAAIVLRRAPVGLEQALTHEAKESGIEGALFDQQRITGDLSDAQEDAVAMQGAERDGSEDEEIETDLRVD